MSSILVVEPSKTRSFPIMFFVFQVYIYIYQVLPSDLMINQIEITQNPCFRVTKKNTQKGHWEEAGFKYFFVFTPIWGNDPI